MPSGDRRVAGLLMDALERVADHVELVSTFRSFDADGDAARQEALRRQGEALARRMAAQWRAAPAALRPDLWFTYHVYYKAPDWLGPAVSAALGIPYVIAEASYAQKRASGPWALGHEAAADAISRARLVISPSRDDVAGLEELIANDAAQDGHFRGRRDILRREKRTLADGPRPDERQIHIRALHLGVPVLVAGHDLAARIGPRGGVLHARQPRDRGRIVRRQRARVALALTHAAL